MSWLDPYLDDLTTDDGPGDPKPKVPAVRPDATATVNPYDLQQQQLRRLAAAMPPLSSIGPATAPNAPQAQLPPYDPSTPRRPDLFAQLITGQGQMAPHGVASLLADLTPGLGQLRGLASGSQQLAAGSPLGALAVIGSMLPGGEGAELGDAERVLGGDLGKLTPKMQKMMDDPATIAARVAKARELLQRPVPGPAEPLDILDRSMIPSPDAGPTNAPLPQRIPFGPRQAAGHMADASGLDSDLNRELISLQTQRGMQMMPNTFYTSHTAVDNAIGNSGGDPALFRHAASGAAIRNGVLGELVGGSAMQYALKQGIISPEMLADAANSSNSREAFENIAKLIRTRYKADFPQAKGLQLMGVHPQAFNALHYGPAADAYKIPTYDLQKTGDFPGFVLDTHESKGGTLASPFHSLFAEQGGFGTQGEYGTQERLYRPIAQDLGLSDRSMQEARWRGGGDITGLRSTPNMDYARIFEGLLHSNALLRGMKPTDLLGQVAKGNNVFFLP